MSGYRERQLDTQFAVPVTVWLPQGVFRALNQRAAVNRTTVGELLAAAVVRRQPAVVKPVRHHMTPETLNRLVQLRQDGKTLAQIAEISGVPQTTVQRRLKRLGLGL